MSDEINLRIPGPVPLPEDIRAVVASPVINHRGEEFADMLKRMTRNMKLCLKTDEELYFVTSSGTGVMEMAVVNTLSPGDTVLCVSIGWFGDRFGDIARAYGMNVEKMSYAAGQAADPDEVRTKLQSLKNVKAVLLTHNESSTGVCNPLKELCGAIKSASDALILVDAISSAGGIELETDKWGVDILATAAQKAWIAPAGISVLTFSKQALRAYEKSTTPKYYLDIGAYRQYATKNQPPFTPCIASMFALDATLDKIASDGIDAAVEQHRVVADKVRVGIRSIGLEILPEKIEFASNTVTAVKLPEGIDGNTFLKRALDEYNVEFGDGPGALKGKLFRLGHMGWLDIDQIEQALGVTEQLLDQMGI